MATYEEMASIEAQIETLKKRRAALIQALPREEVTDYEFPLAEGGTRRLSELFGSHDDLLLIHNMGGGCAYCTLWADGFESLRLHIESRSAFALVSDDEPAAAAAFARSRGWTFPVLSGRHSTFTRDMGFYFEGQGVYPGVSAFHRQADGAIVRTAKTFFGPGDDFCPVWHFFDLLEGGAKGWEPKFRY